jgi:hypothetical protein
MVEAPVPSVEPDQVPEDGDPAPCTEDEEFFVRPDAAGMEKAIGKFLDGLEGQERGGFEEMHRFLATLPVPVRKDVIGMTHAAAIECQFLPDMDEEQRKRFTPSELILYKHAQEHRYKHVCTFIYKYEIVYAFLFTDGRTLSSRRPLQCFKTLSSTPKKWTQICTGECKRL